MPLKLAGRNTTKGRESFDRVPCVPSCILPLTDGEHEVVHSLYYCSGGATREARRCKATMQHLSTPLPEQRGGTLPKESLRANIYFWKIKPTPESPTKRKFYDIETCVSPFEWFCRSRNIIVATEIIILLPAQKSKRIKEA